MDDGRTVIGRVIAPYFREHGAGICPEDSMEAEIATMRYVKTRTSIPVPEVYYHDKDKNGEVGGEWMILEDVQGTNLSDPWWELSLDQRRKVALAIVDVWAQLMHLRFGTIGSIRSSGSPADSFYVGPITFTPTAIRGTTAPPVQSKCGPFSCARDWLLALAREDMKFQREECLTDEEKVFMSTVLKDISAAPPYLDHIESSSNPSLWSINSLHHIDLRLHNIMVDTNDPTIITGVIDWEGASIVPLREVRQLTPDAKLKELEEIRSLMKRALGEAVPEWAKLVAEGSEARLLHVRAKLSTAEPHNVHAPDRYF
ncbi:kinase-like domain-containing protein [Gautieria morchelliformis]|nr:kinase-like domain-containing protein [Gautieria morchelliformis]